MLTTEQIGHYEAFGYLLLRQLFSADEAARMKREAVDIFAEDRGGRPFTGETTQYVQPFFDRRPFLFSLMDDDRIHDIAVSLLGEDFVLDQTEGRLRVEPTPWHAGDVSGSGLGWIKIGFYLDPLTRDTGCLRVVPGSHLRQDPDLFAPLRGRVDDPGFRPFGLPPEEIPCVPIEVEPGDIVVFTECVLHSAFAGLPGRHQHAISFFSNPKTDAQVGGGPRHVRTDQLQRQALDGDDRKRSTPNPADDLATRRVWFRAGGRGIGVNMAEENEMVVRRFIEEALNGRNPELVDELFSADYVNNAATPDISSDLAGYKQRIAYMLKGFPDLHVRIDDMFSSGDRVAVRLTASGTHSFDSMGLSATGKKATWTAIAIYQVADGKILQRWENRDDLGLMQQLGAVG